MGTPRPADSHRSTLRPALVLFSGAVCAAVAGAAPAVADDRPPGPAPLTFADAAGPGVVLPFEVPAQFRPEALGDTVTRMVTDAFGLPPAPPALAPTPAFEPAPTEDFAAAGPLVAPAADTPPAPQAEQIVVGSIEMDRPGIVTPEQAAQINSGAGEVEDGLSDILDSQGMDPARSDEVAAQVVGDTVLGAAIGGVVVAPVAAAVGAVVGGVVGFVFGIPFLPTGLVVGPMVGAATVAALVAAPAVVAGAVIGAGVGAVNGMNAPLDPPPVAG
ncbi:hypothetical protein ACTD5D_13355 [Nocardia takedensis]|uniref:hypothetical protein n=1 Tax=Nocardia takedensis TaxID=259390 RepID=UPI0002ED9F27|nr:hypothetical protein [Nocardia takedensis]